MKKTYTAVLCALALFALTVAGPAGCGKSKEDKQVEEAREWMLTNFSEGKTPAPKPKPLSPELVVEVPDQVKGAYSEVVMGVGFREKMKVEKFNVRLGGEAKVPGTGYTIKVGDYLPNWMVRGNVVTSKNDKPDDPAVRAWIYDENGNEVFNGFIFQRHKRPSFITEDHAIGLLDAVRR